MSLPGPRFTYEDYKLLPEDKQYEVIEGELLMTPAPSGLDTWRVFPAEAAATSPLLPGLSVPVDEGTPWRVPPFNCG